MNRIVFLNLNGAAFVDCVSGDVEHPAHHAFADRHLHWATGIDDFKAAFETFRAGHRDGAHPPVAEMLLHFESYSDGLVLDLIFDRQCVVDSRQRVRKTPRPRPDLRLERFCLYSYSYLPSINSGQINQPARRQSPATLL